VVVVVESEAKVVAESEGERRGGVLGDAVSHRDRLRIRRRRIRSRE